MKKKMKMKMKMKRRISRKEWLVLVEPTVQFALGFLAARPILEKEFLKIEPKVQYHFEPREAMLSPKKRTTQQRRIMLISQLGIVITRMGGDYDLNNIGEVVRERLLNK